MRVVLLHAFPLDEGMWAPQLEALAGPVLVCVGDRDDVLSVEEARSVAAIAPHGRLEVVAGAGHLPSVEQPDRFNSVLAGFLAPWT